MIDLAEARALLVLLEKTGANYALEHEIMRIVDRIDDGRVTPPKYTSSIDAVVALIERALPEANCWGIEKSPRGFDAYVSRNNVASGHWLVEEFATTTPLALLRALMKAVIAEWKTP